MLVNHKTTLLKGQRVGLVSHPAAVMPDLSGALDALLQAGVDICAIWGPEHGFGGGEADGAAVADHRDPRTGIPIFSLYGKNTQPTPKQMDTIDILVFDMQDVGVRFYTYLSTLYYVLRAAATAGKRVVVLDRPNPITGKIVEGPGIDQGYTSFVGIVDIPMRHGMTLGELARYMNAEYQLGAALEVIMMRGWQREMWFDQTGLPWVATSPAMPHLSAAILYPGMCLLEGTNLSVGRGTALPFEIYGAPWLDGYRLAQAMNMLNLAGVSFRPTQFTPSASHFAGKACQGVQAHATNRETLRPVTMALTLIQQVRQQAGKRFEWQATHFDRLIGGATVRQQLEDDKPVAEIMLGWQNYTQEFERRRLPYLLYPFRGGHL